MHFRAARLVGAVCAVALACGLSEAASVQFVQAGVYGVNDVVIENAFLKVVVAPYSGARVKSFLYKPLGAECAAWADGQGGMLRDVSPSVPYPGELGDRAYQYEVLAHEGGEVAVTFRADSARGFRYSRTLKLADGRCALEVSLECENIGYDTKKSDWRLHNMVQALGVKEFARCAYLAPTLTGVRNCNENKFIEDLAGGWMAVAGGDRGGVACVFDYNQTARGLMWTDPESHDFPTLEVFYDEFTLEPRDKWQSTIWIMPFDGLGEVSDASAPGVFACRMEGDKVALKCFGAGNADAEAKLTVRDAGTGAGQAVPARKLALNAGKITETVFDVPGLSAMKATGRVEVSCGGDTTAIVARNFSDAAPLPDRPKKEPRPVVKGQRAQKREIASAEQGAREKIRVLLLSQYDSVKMAKDGFEQDDFLDRAVFRAKEGPLHWLKGDERFDITLAYETDWLDKLAKLYSYDVLVVNDFMGLALEPYAEDILEYVGKGHGLVVLGGYNAYGGRGKEYSNYRKLESLLPVKVAGGPDWVSQLPLPADGGQVPFGKTAYQTTCPVCGDAYVKYAKDDLPIQPNWDFGWLEQGEKLRATDAWHPVVTGLPLETIAPGFHKVAAKENAQVVAAIGQNPAITVMEHGKGRILASMLSDYKKLYFWEQTGRLYGRMIEWAAASGPDVAVRAEIREGRALVLNLRNDSEKEITGVLEASVQGPDNRIYLSEKQTVALKKGQTAERVLDFGAAGPLPAGRSAGKAKFGGREAFCFADVKRDDARVTADFGHRRRYVRGESVRPRLKLSGKVEEGGEYQVLCDMVDARGETAYSSPPLRVKPGATFEIPVDTTRLAFGPYKYNVRVQDAAGGRAGGASEWTYVAKAERPQFLVGWYGFPGRGGSDYATIAGIDLLSESVNLNFGPKVYKTHFCDAADYALEAGVNFMIYATGMAAYGNDAGSTSRRYPPKIERSAQFLQPVLERYKPYPAVTDVYVGDEEWSFSREAFDAEAFRQERGREFPCLPKTQEEQEIYQGHFNTYVQKGVLPDSVDERVMIADYQIESLNIIYRKGSDMIKAARPDWRASMLMTFGVTPDAGNWVEQTFKDMDAIFVDVYPATTWNAGEDLLYMNLLRSSGERQRKPAWIALGEFRSDLNACKMQYWLALMTNMKGIFWYSIGDEGLRNGIRSSKFDQLGPYNRMARDYAPLFHAWGKPPCKVAVLYSKANLCTKVPEPFQRHAVKVFDQLYAKDVSADLVTENEVRSGAIRRYDALVLPGIAMLQSDVIAKLGEYARRGRLYADENTTVAVPGARRFDAAELRAVAPPQVETADERVYGELMTAAGAHYVVLYNHSAKAVQGAEVKVNNLGHIEAVYDAARRARVPCHGAGDAVTFRMDLGAYDGAVVALLDNEVKAPNIALDRKKLKAGDYVEATVSFAPPPKGLVPLSVKILDPDGAATPYSENTIAMDGLCRIMVDTGMNDKRGTWKVAVQDMLGGSAGEAEFNIGAD